MSFYFLISMFVVYAQKETLRKKCILQSDKETPSNAEKEPQSSKEAWGPTKKPEVKLDIKQQQKEVEAIAQQGGGDQWDETSLSKVPPTPPVSVVCPLSVKAEDFDFVTNLVFEVVF